MESECLFAENKQKCVKIHNKSRTLSSLFPSPHVQVLLISPSSAQMSIPHETPGSFSDTLTPLPTIQWMMITSSKLTYLYLVYCNSVIRAAIHPVSNLYQAPSVAFIFSFKS